MNCVLKPVIILSLLCAPALLWAQQRSRIDKPIEIGPQDVKKPRIPARAPREPDAYTTGTDVHLSVPEKYRTLTDSELRREIEQLRAAADRATTQSGQRAAIEEVIDSLETRLETGILPEDLIAEITTDVLRLRGLPLKHPVKFRIMSRDELLAYIDKALDKELSPEYIPNYEFVIKLLGAIPEKTDLRKAFMSLLGEQVAGLYDKDTGILYVMKEFNLQRALAKIILAHEICHAVQDQHFDFSKMDLNPDDNDDLALSIASVIEGDATVLMQEYGANVFTGKDILQLVDAFAIDQDAFNKTPYFMQQHLLFPYLQGAEFIMRGVYTEDGDRDLPLRRMPRSTEQILHPEKYFTFDRDIPTSFTLPDISETLGAGWKLAMQNVFGEFQMKALFETWREWESGRTAAAGWDGDRYCLYRNGKDYVLVWASVWDSQSDAREFADLLTKVLVQKRHKGVFPEMKFEAGQDSIMFEPRDPEKNPVYLRFSRNESGVVCAISNRREQMFNVQKVEGNFFKLLKRKPMIEDAKPSARH